MATERQYAVEGVQVDEQLDAYEYAAEGVQVNESVAAPAEPAGNGLIELPFHKPSLEYDPQDPLNRGLVAWWPFRQFETPGGSWNVRNIAALDDNGQIESMAASDWSRAGSPTGGGAWQIQGLNDLLKCGTKLASKLVNQGTFAIWVKKRTDNPSHTYKGGSWKLNTNGLNNHYPYPTGTIYDGTFVTSRQTIGAGLIADHTQWHQVCVTVDTAGTYRFYQNAQEAYSASLTFDPPDSDPWIGCSATAGSYYFDGSFSDVRIYDRALQPKEVMDLYVASKRGYPTQFKRRSFPVSTSEEAVASGSTAIRLRTPKSTQPSYKAGWAKNAAESSHPNLWDGLVGAWVPAMGPAMGGNGGGLDLSGHGITGNITAGVEHELYKGNYSWNLTPDERMLAQDVNAPPLESLDDVSVVALVAPDTNGTSNLLGVAGKWSVNAASREFLLYGSASKPTFAVGNGSTSYQAQDSATWDLGTWTHLVGTKAGNTISLFRDGELVDSVATYSGSIPSTSVAFEIGRIRSDDALKFSLDGHVAIVLVYNRGLLANEAAQLYGDPLAPFRQRRSLPIYSGGEAAAGAYTLTCDAGSFTETGVDPDLHYNRTLALDAGSYTETGVAASLLVGKLVSLDAGSYTLTGVDVGLSKASPPGSYSLACDAGSFTETGVATDLHRNRLLTLDAGSYTETGVDPGVRYNRLLALDAGSYTETGVATGTLYNRTLALDAGSYTYSGVATSILLGRLISADAGSYTYSGVDATTTWSGATYADWIVLQSASISIPEANGTISVPESSGTIINP